LLLGRRQSGARAKRERRRAARLARRAVRVLARVVGHRHGPERTCANVAFIAFFLCEKNLYTFLVAAMGKRRPEDAGIEMQVSKESFNAHEATSPSHDGGDDDEDDQDAPKPEPMQGWLHAAARRAARSRARCSAAAYGAAPHGQGAPPWPAADALGIVEFACCGCARARTDDAGDSAPAVNPFAGVKFGAPATAAAPSPFAFPSASPLARASPRLRACAHRTPQPRRRPSPPAASSRVFPCPSRRPRRPLLPKQTLRH